MGSDGQEVLELHVGGCVAAGCGCRDGRIVSQRVARFHAYLAIERGETADRVIPQDPDWRLPPVNNEGALT